MTWRACRPARGPVGSVAVSVLLRGGAVILAHRVAGGPTSSYSEIVAGCTTRLTRPSNASADGPLMASRGVIGRAGVYDLGPARHLWHRDIPPRPARIRAGRGIGGDD